MRTYCTERLHLSRPPNECSSRPTTLFPSTQPDYCKKHSKHHKTHEFPRSFSRAQKRPLAHQTYSYRKTSTPQSSPKPYSLLPLSSPNRISRIPPDVFTKSRNPTPPIHSRLPPTTQLCFRFQPTRLLYPIVRCPFFTRGWNGRKIRVDAILGANSFKCSFPD